MVKLNVSTLNRLNIMGFFVNAKSIHKCNVILTKTVTKHFTILTKCFFPYLNPTSYLKKIERKLIIIFYIKKTTFSVRQIIFPGTFSFQKFCLGL